MLSQGSGGLGRLLLFALCCFDRLGTTGLGAMLALNTEKSIAVADEET